MAETYKRVCIEDYSIVEGEDRLDVKRGREYTTSPERNGHVCVFSTYVAWVPTSIFAGERRFTL